MPDDESRSVKELRTVVYATDFSLYSQSAGLYAARIAESLHAKLLVVHAFTPSQAAMEVEIDHLLVSQQRSDLSFLLARKAALLSSPSVEAIPMLLEGDPKAVIPRLAEQQGPSLMVLGTHGGGWIQRELIGSVAEQVLRSTASPSLTVGPHVKPRPTFAHPFKQILFATDFAPEAAKAAAYARTFSGAFHAQLDILHVATEDAVKHPQKLAEMRARFFDAMEKTGSQQAKEFCPPCVCVEKGRVKERILTHIRDHAVDLLILAIRNTSSTGLEMRTSGVFPLVVAAECPVLTVAD